MSSPGGRKDRMRFYLFIYFFLWLAGFENLEATIYTIDSKESLFKNYDECSAGDTLFIKAGEYNIPELVIAKAITLIGESGAVLDATDQGQLVKITADSVVVQGLTFQHVQTSFIDDNAAVKVDNAKYCSIQNNVFRDTFFAIYLAKSQNIKIVGNQIHSNATRESTSGNGIHLWYCKDIHISENKVTGHRDGIYLEFVRDSFIVRNFSANNLRYGLHFMFSDNCTYSYNTLQENGAGVAVMYTKKVKMTDNKFYHNWGSAAFGLLLKEIADSYIQRNKFIQNSVGLYAESSNRNVVQGNTFTQNGWAVKIMGNCLQNEFTQNEFLGNSFDVATNSQFNYNNFRANYWDKYTGYDLNRDGVGDVPYRPVSLFSYLVEKNEPALVLLNSFFIEMLNVAEKALPILTPGTLEDPVPRMRRNR